MSKHKNLTSNRVSSGGAARAFLLCLFLCSLMPGALAAQESLGAPAELKEYFHQQDAHTALLLRLEAYEASFESRVFTPENVLVKASGVPTLRLGPVFQFIEPVDKPRQLRIQISITRSTSASRVDLRVQKFDQGGPDSSTLIKAYRLLSHGLEIEKSNRQDSWTMKVISLKQAANIFDFLGMQELQLWSEFYTNYYLLMVLGDPLTAMEGAREIYPVAMRSNFRTLALAALQMEGSAIIAQVGPGPKAATNDLFGQAQEKFQQAADLAANMELPYERAKAIFNSGLAWESAEQNEQAFARFDLALNVADSAGDTDFANLIRQHAAELHEAQGETSQAIALMQDISATQEPPPTGPVPDEAESGPAISRSDREMASYLLDQGRLLEKTFRYTEAAEVLLQALALDEKAPSTALTGPALLLLGKALYAGGQIEEAAQRLREGIEKAAAYRSGSELEAAYGMLASIQRQRGDFAGMKELREGQKQFIDTQAGRAAYRYEQALDAVAMQGAGSKLARSLLQESEALARQDDTNGIGQLAVLQLCALPGTSPGEACASGQGQQALSSLEASGLPAAALEGRLLWAQILQRSGQAARAAVELDRLVDDMLFYQSWLPGVLGAWYWQQRENVFTSLMDLSLQLTAASADGRQSLLVLDRLNRFDASVSAGAARAQEQSALLDRLRSLVAARAAAVDRAQAREQANAVNPVLQQARGQWGAGSRGPGAQDLRLDQLSSDEAFLAYYITEQQAYAWLGRNSGLKRVRLKWTDQQSAELSRTIEGLRWDLSQGSASNFTGIMDRLGEWLLEPLSTKLPRTLLVLPLGRLEGLPFDALRLDGAFLAAQHQVINLVSLDALASHAGQLEARNMQSFFLAGNRETSAGDFEVFTPTPEEIRTVADFFVGPDLHIVQGSALQWDEFEDERFTGAGNVHLAMPGVIDLRNPELSRLLLSDNIEDLEHTFLLPADIIGKEFAASLVVLSGVGFSGTSQSAFESNSRIIGDFLNAGAGAVIASLWQVADAEAAGFWKHFYSLLLSNPDIGEALAQTKRGYLGDAGMANSGVWAAFQLFAD